MAFVFIIDYSPSTLSMGTDCAHLFVFDSFLFNLPTYFPYYRDPIISSFSKKYLSSQKRADI